MEDLSVYFREPENAGKCTQDDIDGRAQHLADLYAAAAHTLQDRNNRQQALTWAIDTVAQSPLASARHWRHILCDPLADTATHAPSSASTAYAAELLRMFCEDRPAETTATLQRYRPEAFERLFEGSGGERHILAWFGRFDAGGGGQAGAAALSAFALAHRADVWHLLAWRSRHPHAPVTVAASPQYWAELDVVETVRALLRGCPRFWASDELHRALRVGDLVRLDAGFFAGQLLALLQRGARHRSGSPDSRQRGRSSGGDGGRDRGSDRDRGRDRDDDRDRHRRAADRVLADVSAWVDSSDHTLLCRRLMPLLPEATLMSAFTGLASDAATAGSGAGAGGGDSSAQADRRQSDAAAAAGSAAADAVARQLVFGTRWSSLDELLLAHAAAFRAVELWRWLQEDEDCLQVARRALAELQRPDHLPLLWAVCHDARRRPADVAARLLLAEKLSAHLFLHDNVGSDAEKVEHLLRLRGIQFSRLPELSKHLLLESPKRKHKQKHKRLKRSHKKRKRSVTPEEWQAGTGEGHADVTWQAHLHGESGKADKCSAQQLHAVIALQMLACLQTTEQ